MLVGIHTHIDMGIDMYCLSEMSQKSVKYCSCDCHLGEVLNIVHDCVCTWLSEKLCLAKVVFRAFTLAVILVNFYDYVEEYASLAISSLKICHDSDT